MIPAGAAHTSSINNLSQVGMTSGRTGSAAFVVQPPALFGPAMGCPG